MSENVADTLLTTLAFEPDVPLFIGLFVSELKNSEVNTREVMAKEYGRQSIRLIGRDAFLINQNDISFSKALSGWGLLTHIAVFDNVGRMLLYKSVGGVYEIVSGRRVGFPTGGLELYVRRNYVRAPAP